jgi:hypothetical protein
LTHDRFEYSGMVLAAFTSAICTVVAVVCAVKSVKRAKDRSDGLGDVPPLIVRGWFGRSWRRISPWLPAVSVVSILALLVVSVFYQFSSLSKTTVPPWKELPRRAEVVNTPAWQTWREQIHEILSVEPVTDSALIRALRIMKPSLPDPHTEAEALRMDQAMADVVLSYDDVKKILADQFGIRQEFLGTGMSKPLGSTPYSLASVHEYFVENHLDTHDHVWLWKITRPGRFFSHSLQSFIAGEKGQRVAPDNREKKTTNFDDDLSEILLRIKNKDHPFPPMIRFARFDQLRYKGTLGRPTANRVFTSNLTEVWDLTIQQAAEKSGYMYKDGGDTLFIWVYVPFHSNEFTPATWRHVLAYLPEWLENKEH